MPPQSRTSSLTPGSTVTNCTVCGEGSVGRDHAVAWVDFWKVKGVPEPCVHVPVMVLPSGLSLPS